MSTRRFERVFAKKGMVAYCAASPLRSFASVMCSSFRGQSHNRPFRTKTPGTLSADGQGIETGSRLEDNSGMPLVDRYHRPVKDLRISVTDRCNYRCNYCMPFDEYTWIEKAEVLSFEEISRLATLFIQLGVEKIRLTGGEPLVRRDLEKLIAELSPLPG